MKKSNSSIQGSNKSQNNIGGMSPDMQFLYKESTRLGKVGGWTFDTQTFEQKWTDEVYYIHELDLDYEPNVEKGISFYTEDSKPIIEDAVQKAIEDETPYDLELTIKTAKGNIRWVKAIGVPDKANHRVYGFFQDITERVAFESALKTKTEELIRTNMSLEDALTAKDHFLTNMCHEIRTPLHGILGSIQLLMQSYLTDEQKDLLNISHDSMEQLLLVFNDIMDYSKLQNSQIPLKLSTFNVLHLAAEVIALFSLPARKKSIDLILDVDPRYGYWYLGDRYRIKQILSNLVGNALKFTEKGSIRLSVIIEPCENDNVDITFKIIDTGIGVSTENLEFIFKRFNQVDSSNTRRYGGNGLGLSIVRELIELMNGEIWVDSELGKGSCFSFRLRLSETDQTGFE